MTPLRGSYSAHGLDYVHAHTLCIIFFESLHIGCEVSSTPNIYRKGHGSSAQYTVTAECISQEMLNEMNLLEPFYLDLDAK